MLKLLMKKYLEASEYIDFNEKSIHTLAKELALNCISDEQIAKNCFLYVLKEIRHIGDYKLDDVSIKASEVLKNKSGWCYAKAHLLAALLRANSIPTALCYQRLSCSEYKDGIYCLHGLNAIYLKEHGWYRVDIRGNKEGINAQFNPPNEKLAFVLQENEFDIEEKFHEPIVEVITALKKYKTYNSMINNFPDMKNEEGRIK